CLHVAAVLRALPPADAAPPDEVATAGGPESPETAAVRPAQRQAAAEAWRAGAALLEVGAGAAGAVVEGELLRAAHSCRVASLPRLATASARAAGRVRQL